MLGSPSSRTIGSRGLCEMKLEKLSVDEGESGGQKLSPLEDEALRGHGVGTRQLGARKQESV